MRSVALVIGTRPQFIKLAPLISASKGKLDLLIIDTGQHYDKDLSSDFIKEFNITPPHYYLGVGSCSHGLQTGRMLGRLDVILSQEKPDVVAVFGDTNSTLAGALAGAKLKMPIAHIEAGTRNNDLTMPEEINRRMVDSISTYLFPPTATTMRNLLGEGHKGSLHMVGDIMVDSLERSVRASERSKVLEAHDLKKKEYVVCTVHRPSNTDDKDVLKSLIGSLNSLDFKVMIPLHPRTLKKLYEYGLMDYLKDNIKVIEPVSHMDMIALMKDARCVLTDSGGLVKEAYLLKVPCVTLRDSTEWPETVSAGYNKVVGHDRVAIMRAVELADSNSLPSHHADYFGRPSVSERIVTILEGE